MSYEPEVAYDLNQTESFNPSTGELGISSEVRRAFEFPGKVEPGLYFGMSGDQYHAIPALSASGIKNLLTSSMDFWARSWLNQWRDDDRAEEDTEAKEVGTAYHVRLLEGKEKFYQVYAPKFQCDNPNAIEGNKALTAALKKLQVGGLSGKNQAELCQLLRNADPSAVIYHDLEEKYIRENPGRKFLPWGLIRRMELAAAMIENHPELKFYFRGGYPEVTCVWEDPQHGVLYKIRKDYLKIKATNDLKTFANQQMKGIERAVYAEMANHKYFIPGSLYLRGSDAAKDHVRAGRIFGTPPPVDWLKAFEDSPPHDMNFVFQQKGIAPVTKAALYSRKDSMFEIGLDNVRHAAEIFKKYWLAYQDSPWIDLGPGIVLNFSEYPTWAGQI